MIVFFDVCSSVDADTSFILSITQSTDSCYSQIIFLSHTVSQIIFLSLTVLRQKETKKDLYQNLC